MALLHCSQRLNFTACIEQHVQPMKKSSAKSSQLLTQGTIRSVLCSPKCKNKQNIEKKRIVSRWRNISRAAYLGPDIRGHGSQSQTFNCLWSEYCFNALILFVGWHQGQSAGKRSPTSNPEGSSSFIYYVNYLRYYLFIYLSTYVDPA